MSDNFEQPIMRCPACAKEHEDFDGVGVVYCKPPEGCGFCRHLARTGKKREGNTVWVCDFCGHVRGEEE
jgi:ribosomal protein L37AE/L43A